LNCWSFRIVSRLVFILGWCSCLLYCLCRIVKYPVFRGCCSCPSLLSLLVGVLPCCRVSSRLLLCCCVVLSYPVLSCLRCLCTTAVMKTATLVAQVRGLGPNAVFHAYGLVPSCLVMSCLSIFCVVFIGLELLVFSYRITSCLHLGVVFLSFVLSLSYRILPCLVGCCFVLCCRLACLLLPVSSCLVFVGSATAIEERGVDGAFWNSLSPREISVFFSLVPRAHQVLCLGLSCLVLCCVVLFCPCLMLCCVVFCYLVLCCLVLCCGMLCCVVLSCLVIS
jgi:hypothetical protein